MSIHESQGICPKCESAALDYIEDIPQEETTGHRFTCKDCSARGVEWFSHVYCETIIDDD